MTLEPQVELLWIVAMLTFGGIGVIIHLLLIFKTIPQISSSSILKKEGKIFIFGCVLVFLFNGVACLFWLVFRTDLFIHLSISICQFIYTTNFVFYFVAKYILHCLLIGRIYLTFYNTGFQMKFKVFLLFICIVSVNFFVSIALWIYQVTPHILIGIWSSNNHTICTLFSEEAQRIIAVKLCAVSIGFEDFIVSSITLYIILKRFAVLRRGTDDTELVLKSIRYGTVASIAMISTLFLFTLAVLFWSNVTFIIPIDAMINSICLFCVLAVGETSYYYLCFPFRVCAIKCIENEEAASETIVGIVIHEYHETPPPPKLSSLKTVSNNLTDSGFNYAHNIRRTPMKLKDPKSAPVSTPISIQQLQKAMDAQAVSNPFFGH